MSLIDRNQTFTIGWLGYFYGLCCIIEPQLRGIPIVSLSPCNFGRDRLFDSRTTNDFLSAGGWRNDIRYPHAVFFFTSGGRVMRGGQKRWSSICLFLHQMISWLPETYNPSETYVPSDPIKTGRNGDDKKKGHSIPCFRPWWIWWVFRLLLAKREWPIIIYSCTTHVPIRFCILNF